VFLRKWKYLWLLFINTVARNHSRNITEFAAKCVKHGIMNSAGAFRKVTFSVENVSE
jgi:hypothetical protein